MERTGEVCRHFTLKAEDAQKEQVDLDGSLTVKAEGAQKELVDSDCAGTLSVEDALKELTESKRASFEWQKRRFA